MTATASPRPKLSLPRRLLFVGVIVLGQLCLLEGGSWVALRWIEGEWRGPGSVRQQRRELMGLALGRELDLPARHAKNQNHVLHPYLGYVHNPARPARPNWVERGLAVNDFGFVDDASPLAPRQEGEALVALTGGSVADQMHTFASQVLEQELWAGGYFEGVDRLRIVNLAIDGYKQPQQAQALQYLLNMGASFDAVINLDGFNDVGLHLAENVFKGVHPAFPRGWFFLATANSSAATRSLIQRATAMSSVRRALSRRVEDSFLAVSAFGNLLWLTQDRRQKGEIDQIQQNLLNLVLAPEDIPFEARGPQLDLPGDEACVQELAAMWQRCSRMMHQLCDANGIAYHHFLQPNQYIAPSKPMSDKERRHVISDDHPYTRGAVMGYPHLQRLGEELRREGVAYADLTGIFAEVQEPLYVDDCCHLSERGYALLARAVAEQMIRQRHPGR